LAIGRSYRVSGGRKSLCTRVEKLDTFGYADPMNRGSYKAVIFDLDGTLVDSMGDIAASVNKVLHDLSLLPHETDFYKDKVGWGLRKTLELSLPEIDSDNLDRALVSLHNYYRNDPCSHTTVYNGINGMIHSLIQRGLTLFVYTNKDQTTAERIVRLFFSGKDISSVYGAVSGVPLKPNTESIRNVIRKTGFAPNEILYVGDSEIDLETAENGNLDALAVLWGYRSREQLENYAKLAFVDRPDEIIKWIV